MNTITNDINQTTNETICQINIDQLMYKREQQLDVLENMLNVLENLTIGIKTPVSFGSKMVIQ